jgi:hypothetical protein
MGACQLWQSSMLNNTCSVQLHMPLCDVQATLAQQKSHVIPKKFLI